MRALVKTALSPYTGYGNDGIGIVQALLAAGVDTYVDPSHISAPLPPVVANLLTKRLAAPFDLLIHHADPGQLGITPEARRAARTTVAWTMWEYTSLNNLRGRSTLRRRLRDYDLVLGYDTVSAGALAPYASPGQLGVLQGGFWPQQWPAVSRDWDSDRLGFLMVGQLHSRKDPMVSIQAFVELKNELPDEFAGAELHLKGQPLDSPVLTPTGWVAIGDLGPGDLVVDPGGGTQKVVGVQDLGEQDIYEVRLRDGSATRCTWDHLWQVKLEAGPWRVLTTQQLVEGGLWRKKHCRWELPLVKAPDLEGPPPTIDPYVIGLLLGDGHMSASPSFGSADPELIDAMRERLPVGVSMVHRYTRGDLSWYGLTGKADRSVDACVGPGPHAPGPKRTRGLCSTCSTRARRAGTLQSWPLTGGPSARRNVLYGPLHDLGLVGKHSWDKFVPDPYLYGSREVRLEVLRGLMDTDGTPPSKNAGPSFTSCSRRLADDVRSLVHSLGGTAAITTMRPTYAYKGEVRTGREAYQVKVTVPVNPFRLSRKARQWDLIQSQRQHPLRHRIVSVERVGRAQVRCILVSGVEGLYVTSDYIVTHNTNVPGLHRAMEQWVPKLRIHYSVWPDDVLREFYGAQHVLLAPSRGEGKNMPALEFLSTGGTVIATAWGGHQQWLSPAIGYPLDYVLRSVSPQTPNCQNARADKDHLKALMLHVYRERGEAARKGELAAQLIPQMCSWPAVLVRLFDKLAECQPGFIRPAPVGSSQDAVSV
jgi:glycosyltransferase involved in cell wall biosynthesis